MPYSKSTITAWFRIKGANEATVLDVSRTHPSKIEAHFSRTRLSLIVCLIPILALWYYLLSAVPMTYYQGTRGFFANPEKRTVTIHGESHFREWEQNLVFDFNSGKIRVEENATLARSNKICWPVFVKSLTYEGKVFKRWRCWASVPGKEGAGKPWEFDFPADSFPRIIGDRFAVHVATDTILVQDTHADSPKTTAYPTNGRKDSWAIAVGNTNRFFTVDVDPLTLNSQSPLVVIELFELDETGFPELIHSWKGVCAMNAFSSLSITDSSDQFISIHPTENAFEIRSTVDGSLIRRQPLPEDFLLTRDKWHLDRNTLLLNSGARAYSINQSCWLKTPPGFKSFFYDSPNHKLRLWIVGDDSTQVITDCDTEEVVSTIALDEDGAFLDDGTLVFHSTQWGLTLREIDAKTGRTTKTWRPYWWVLPAMWLSILAYLLWSFAWIKSASGNSRWLWADIFWTSCFPILALAFRVKMVGDTLDLERDPFFLLQGLFSGLIFMASFWACHSHEWMVRRLLPLFFVLASLTSSLALIFTDRLETTSNFVIQACLLIAMSVGLWLLVALLGFRSNVLCNHEDQKRSSLRDLFTLTFLSALIIASMRLVIPNLMTIDLTNIHLSSLILICMASSFGMATFLSTNRYVFILGRTLSIVLLFYLLFVLPSYFLLGEPWFRFLNQQEGFAITVATSFVTTFILSGAFRHGLRIPPKAVHQPLVYRLQPAAFVPDPDFDLN